MKTARMTIVLEPEAKAEIETRARAAKMSTGEFVRAATRYYDPRIDDEVLEALVGQFAETMKAMSDRMRETADRTDRRLAEIAALRATVHGPG